MDNQTSIENLSDVIDNVFRLNNITSSIDKTDQNFNNGARFGMLENILGRLVL